MEEPRLKRPQAKVPLVRRIWAKCLQESFGGTEIKKATGKGSKVSKIWHWNPKVFKSPLEAPRLKRPLAKVPLVRRIWAKFLQESFGGTDIKKATGKGSH